MVDDHTLELVECRHIVQSICECLVTVVDSPLCPVLYMDVTIYEAKRLHCMFGVEYVKIPHAGIEPATIGSLARRLAITPSC